MIWRPARRSATPRHAVDRFAVLDGCVVASGWSEGGAPVLLVQGSRLAGVSARSVARPDVERHLGEGTRVSGFRLSAVLPDGCGPTDLALRFGNHEVSPEEVAARRSAAAVAATGDLGALLARFVAAMDGPGARLLEIGSRARSGRTYRDVFPAHVDYVGLDVAAGPNVDVVGDAHHLRRHVSGRFGFVFSISVFEHLVMPWKVALEMNGVMEAGGLAFIQSHAAWPLHEEPWDFFRFSRDAWRGLFNAHTGFEMVDTAYERHAGVVPVDAGGGALAGLDIQPAFLLSACLVRKTGDARVRWDEEAAEIYDLDYSHGRSSSR